MLLWVVTSELLIKGSLDDRLYIGVEVEERVPRVLLTDASGDVVGTTALVGVGRSSSVVVRLGMVSEPVFDGLYCVDECYFIHYMMLTHTKPRRRRRRFRLDWIDGSNGEVLLRQRRST
jgi:hypothetical protein